MQMYYKVIMKSDELEKAKKASSRGNGHANEWHEPQEHPHQGSWHAFLGITSVIAVGVDDPTEDKD